MCVCGKENVPERQKERDCVCESLQEIKRERERERAMVSETERERERGGKVRVL